MNNDNPLGRAAGGPPRRQIFDVVRPGATPASPTSRPVIAQTAISDPNVAMSGVGEAAQLRQARQVPPQSVQPQPVQPQPNPPLADDPASRPESQPVSSPPAPYQPVVVSRPSYRPQNMPPSGNNPLPAEAGPPLSVQPPAQVPVPSHYPNKKGIISEVLAVLAIVLLLAVIMNILLDAEVINLPLPHTNFFDY